MIFFHVSAQNIDCGYSLEPPRRGGSSKYPQSMCLSRNKKNNVYPCKPQFYYIKWGFRGSKLYRYVFVMLCHLLYFFFFFFILTEYHFYLNYLDSQTCANSVGPNQIAASRISK